MGRMNPTLNGNTTENLIETARLLVVSREPAVFRMLGPLEAPNAWRLETAANGWEAMERMQSGAAAHLLVLDISFQDSEPMHFLRWLSCYRPDFPVVLLCCPDDVGRVQEATGLGAEDVVAKPFELKNLEMVIGRHLNPATSGSVDNASKNKNIEPLGPDTCFVSASLLMQKLRAQAALLAKSDVPVLIVGERGAGKYTVASLIHKLSVRSGFKLLRVNCAAMPEADLEAELFGPDRAGAARATSLGKFAAGEKGTILLEEIADMPAGVQLRLLQVLQNHEQRSPAGNEAMPEVRILASSSANLDRALAEKQLREDLYHRLSGFTLQVPALRQRKEEVATLLRYFMHNLARHYGLPPRGFSSNMLMACQQYSWPGNLRELEAFVKRYLVAGDQELTLGEIAVDGAGRAANVAAARIGNMGATALEKGARDTAAARPESLKSLVQGVKWEAERTAIGAALTRTGWNRKAAARLLKVSYRTLLYKIEQYHMRAPQGYLSPLPAGEFPGYEEGKGNGKAS
jgi:two-component system, NtrC family, response regulator AtoC